MSVRAELTCDRCRIVVDLPPAGPACGLPEGWALTDWNIHSCPGCSTREEREQREAMVGSVLELIARVLNRQEDEA